MTTLETIRKKPVDTNQEPTRVQRALNQFDFYGIEGSPQTHKVTFKDIIGLPLRERLGKVRQALYPRTTPAGQINFDKVDTGVDFQQVVSRKRWILGKFYPDIALVEENLLPNLCALVDSLEKVIGGLDETMQKLIALRLASFLYIFGIYLHPSADGNGQTFQCAALSYLHQFNPDLRQRYFPIKYSNLYLPMPHYFPRPSDTIAEINLPTLNLNKDHPHFLTHERLLDALRRESEILRIDFNRENGTLAKHDLRSIQLLLKIVNELVDIKDLPIAHINQISCVNPFNLDDDFRKAVSAYFLKDGFNKTIVENTINRKKTKAGVAAYYLSLLLQPNTAGRDLLVSYVLGTDAKEIIDQNPDLQRVWGVVQKELRHLEEGMQIILDDDFISSEKALVTQRTTALVYQPIAEELEKRGLTHKIFSRISRNFEGQS